MWGRARECRCFVVVCDVDEGVWANPGADETPVIRPDAALSPVEADAAR